MPSRLTDKLNSTGTTGVEVIVLCFVDFKSAFASDKDTKRLKLEANSNPIRQISVWIKTKFYNR